MRKRVSLARIQNDNMPRVLTNKYGLPDTLFRAITHDTHKLAGDISVTTLIDSPKIRILKKMHTYEEDVSDGLYALMGTALHHILERANIKSSRKRAFITTAETIMSEGDKMATTDPAKADVLRRGANWIFSLIPVFFPEIGDRYVYEITMQIDINGTIISGTFDLYDKTDRVLWDYKFCSTFQYTAPGNKVKWERQTNIYAYMLREQHGFQVDKIKVVAFFRDWNRYGFVRNREYPDRQIKEMEMKVYPNNEILDYLVKRVELHKRAESGQIPDCTGEEKWSTADMFAVKQGTVKKAVRVYDNKIAADTFIAENKNSYEIPGGKGKLWIEVRPGESRRCEEYCPVSQFCEQRKRDLEKIASYEQ